MHWIRLEETILSKLTPPARNMTPRERTLLLFAIGLVLLGGPVPMLGVVVASLGEHVGWYLLTLAGNVMYAAGLFLLALVIAVGACLTIMYGD